MLTTQPPRRRPVDQLRADLAAANVHAYKVAARASIHPMTLSRILNGHIRLLPDVEQRIRRAIRDEVSDGGLDAR